MIIGCEKEITVDLPVVDSKTVIEGAIEEGQYAWVFVTKTAAYFAPFDSSVAMNMIDKNARIIVTDGVLVDTLHLTIDPFTFPFLKYVGSIIKGQIGKRYWLRIETNGKVYTANTTIPQPVPLDSLVFKPDIGQDTLGYIWIYLKDPDTLGNYYRGFTKVLGKDPVFLHPYPSVYDDRFFNGQTAEYQLYRGRNPLEDSLYNDNGLDSSGVSRFYYKRGETVVVKIAQIDAKHYEFWYSLEQQFMTEGNPFTSPASVKTNIEGGAIGVWGGYGASLDTFAIPKK